MQAYFHLLLLTPILNGWIILWTAAGSRSGRTWYGSLGLEYSTGVLDAPG
jgi:hypothetical protein